MKYETTQTQQAVPITEAMLRAAGDTVEQAIALRDMQGILFLQVGGGMWVIYNPTYEQALRLRFPNLEAARAFAIRRVMDRSTK